MIDWYSVYIRKGVPTGRVRDGDRLVNGAVNTLKDARRIGIRALNESVMKRAIITCTERDGEEYVIGHVWFDGYGYEYIPWPIDHRKFRSIPLNTDGSVRRDKTWWHPFGL